MDLILSYVGTQIWGTRQSHVLLLTSRKSCLVTSRGKRVRAGNAGWEGEGGGGGCARAASPVLPPSLLFGSGQTPRQGRGVFLQLSRCAILWRNCCTDCLRRFLRRGLHTGVTQRLTTIAAKKKHTHRLLNNTTSDMLSARCWCGKRNNSIRVYVVMRAGWKHRSSNRIKAHSEEHCAVPLFVYPLFFFLITINN